MEERIIIKVSELLNHSQTYCNAVKSDFLELSQDNFTAPDGNINYEFVAEKIGDEVLIRGIVSIPFLFRCSRCNDIFKRELKIEDFTRTCHISMDSEIIDLTDDVREDILLALPSYWVCSEECRGLCFQCGANLNKTNCKCERRNNNNIWDVLNKLNIK